MNNSFFIPYNTPSSKNGKNWNGRFLENSETVKRWQVKTQGYWLADKIRFRNLIKNLPKPVFVHMTFIRDGRRPRWDYINPAETILDEMRNKGWIEDDDVENVVPVFGKYSNDPKKPGVYIRLLKSPPQYEFL